MTYWGLVVFKVFLPPTLSFLYLFGFSKYIAVKFDLANTKEMAKNEFEILEYLDPHAYKILR